MSMFILAISCLTTSNLPWFMDLAFRFLCNIALYSIRPCFCHQSYPQLCIVFTLALPLHYFWSYFSTDFLYHIGQLLSWGVHLSVSYLFAFSYCSWSSQGKNTEVVCHSLLQWTTFCQTHVSWVALHGMAHSFIELDKAMVHVISLLSFLWLWFSFCLPLKEYG